MNNKKKKKAFGCIFCHSNLTIHLKAKDYLHNSSNKEYSIYKCPKCHAELILPRPSQKEIESFYPINYYSFHVKTAINKDFFIVLREKIVDIAYNESSTKNLFYFLAKLFKSLLPGIPLKHIGKKRFLDVGCGDGYSLDLLSRYRWQSTGFEIGSPLKRKNIHYGKSIIDVDFKNKKFDFIRVWHVLEHVPNPNEFMRKISSLIADEGRIVFGVPNTNSLNARLFGKYWYNRDIPRHLVNYRPFNLKILVEKHNFEIKKLEYNQFGGFLDSVLRVLSEISHIPLKPSGKIKLFMTILTYPIDYLCNRLKIGDLFYVEIVSKK